MSNEAMKLALARLQARTDTADLNAIAALNEALDHIANGGKMIEQPAQQEPVAKVCHDLDGHIGWNPNLRQLPDEGTALYTSPQHTWVDLTDDEIKKEFHPLHATGLQFARAVLAKSKEKNT